MIDFKDRIPTYPGRVILTPVAGETNKYDMVRADEPIEPGTIINKALMASIAKETNLLDNWDFRKPVNQRGQTTYTENAKYSIDRWKLDGENTVVTVNQGYINLKKNSLTLNASFRQFIDNPTSLSGKTVTFSVDMDIVASGNGVVLQYFYDGNWSNEVLFTGTGRAIRSATFTLPTITSQICFFVSMNGVTSVYANVNLYRAKLELGSVSTLANDSPMNYQQEYLKCLRYFYKGSVQYLWAIADIDSYSSATYFRMMFPIPMRIIPTIIIPGRTIVTNGSYTPFVTKEGIYLVGTTSGIPDTQGGWLDIEASADL